MSAVTEQQDHPRLKDGPSQVRHYLVLLGLICQGFACDHWMAPLVFGVLWYAALRYQCDRRWLPESLEVLVLFMALVGAYRFAHVVNMVWFASVSNALVLYQLFRLCMPLDRRQKVYTAAVAVTQIAVGAQAVFDYRFIPILLAMLVLVPATLFELEAHAFHATVAPRRCIPNWRVTAAMLCLMVAFFLLFPRYQLNPFASRFGAQRGSRLRELEMAGTADDSGEQMVFRIEGRDVDYLRCIALDVFDGKKWTAHPKAYKARRRPYSDDHQDTLYRQVKVAAPRLLQNALPVDGQIVDMAGDYTQWPFVAEHGGVMMPLRLRRKITYEYWTRPGPLRQSMSADLRRRYLQMPEPTVAIRQWLDQHTGTADRPDEVISKLLLRFQSDFEYQVSAPTLSEDAPLEDFLLVQKRGHCSRFASALAALLRLRGIPSRVVLGYLPVEKNALGGFYNVRTRHAHAWTEAWLDGQGWVTVDATPVGTNMPVEQRRLALTLYEWVEFVWYAKIVEFGFSDQVRFAGGVSAAIQSVIATTFRHWGTVLTGLGVVIATVLAMRSRPRSGRRRNGALQRQRAAQEASHFYGLMLRELARQKLVRFTHQTPLEFMHELERREHERIVDICLITQLFCRVHYGAAELPTDTRSEVEAALHRIRRSRKRVAGAARV